MNSAVFRVRRRFTERHRVVTGVFLPIAYAVDLEGISSQTSSYCCITTR